MWRWYICEVRWYLRTIVHYMRSFTQLIGEQMTSKRIAVILPMALVTLMLLSSASAVAQHARDTHDTSENEDIDYTRRELIIVNDPVEGVIKLKLGESEMLVSYGDGRIELATIQTRYLGVADLYDENGDFVKRVGIPAETIVWQRLVGVLEYVDSNNNGLFDIHGAKLVGTVKEIDDGVTHEVVMKYIDYDDITWSLTGYQQVQSGHEIDIRFTISAGDIPYQSDDGPIDSKTVARIAYKFHVSTVEGEVQLEMVPHYRIRYNDRGVVGDEIDESRLSSRANVTGHVLNSVWKYDQIIQGWDVATDNVGVERNDTRLFVMTEMAHGVHLKGAVGEWMREQYGGLMSPRAIAGHQVPPPTDQHLDDFAPDEKRPDHDENGHPLRCGLAYVSSDGSAIAPSNDTEARSQTTDGGNDSDDSGDNYSKVRERIHHYTETACRQHGDAVQHDGADSPEVIRAGAIHFSDAGARFGVIRWVSNATIDNGIETEVLFQIAGMRPVLPEDIDGNDGLWAGIRIVGGYNYVLGERVYHDPEFSSDVVTVQIEAFGEASSTFNTQGLLRVLLTRALPLMLGLMVVVTIIVGVARTNANRDAPMPGEGYSASGGWQDPGSDWDQYMR